jgi:LysM repeat protein
MRFTFTTAAFALAAFASSALAHIEMLEPAPFRSKNNKLIDQSTVDFDMTSPLKPDGSNFPCKGYHEDFNQSPAGDPTATWAPGSSQTIAFGGSANHDGGSCQLSLSFDGGKTFKVIKSYEGNCVGPQGSNSLDFTVPTDTKSGKAIFAWTWFNHTGNREMYMNCAAVAITGTGSSTLDDRPEIFKANIGNGCKTTEETDVEFPSPGPDLDVLSKQFLRPPSCDKPDSSQPQPDQSADPLPSTEPTDVAEPEPTKSDSEDSTSSTESTTSSATSDSPADATYSAAPIDSVESSSTKKPVSTRTSSVSASAPTATPTGDLSPKYTVKAGDICMNIAKQQGVSLDTLYKLNPSINKGCTNLQVGQDLTIRRRSRIMRDLN